MNTNNKKLVHHRKANGTTYVYEVVENHWDKEKKQPRSKQVCIGKLDPGTGDLIPSKRLGEHALPAMDPAVTAKTSISGPALLLKKVDRDLGACADGLCPRIAEIKCPLIADNIVHSIA